MAAGGSEADAMAAVEAIAANPGKVVKPTAKEQDVEPYALSQAQAIVTSGGTITDDVP